MTKENKKAYWQIFETRIDELTGSDTVRKSNDMGSARIMLVFTPLILLTTVFE